MRHHIFLGNLAYQTNEDGLRDWFVSNGYEVTDVRIVVNRERQRSAGYGFVSIQDASKVGNAIEKLNGAMLDGRVIKVQEADHGGR
jgi:RNA recognition motif-containing protein